MTSNRDFVVPECSQIDQNESFEKFLNLISSINLFQIIFRFKKYPSVKHGDEIVKNGSSFVSIKFKYLA